MIRLIAAVFTVLVSASFSLTSARSLDNTWDYSVQVSSVIEASPARITLNWSQDTTGEPTSYTVFRKTPEATTWGEGVTLAGSALGYTDTNVTVGKAYEYRIVKVMPRYTGYGYIQTGIQVPLVDRRGGILLVVDNTFSETLAPELARLERDLVGDGWTVTRRDVRRSDSVATVKNTIKAVYDANPGELKSVFLFGHIAVPYSGQLNPDGHADHVGAWPADAYYGDMDGQWTDATVSYAQTLNRDPVDAERMSNFPGDGKFDQSVLPSAVELMVGRVDLANMPGRREDGTASFANETELLRNYLNKDHNFRHRKTTVPRRAVVGDYFGLRGGESFAASGYRSFAPLVGAQNIRNLNREFDGAPGVWIPEVAKADYLLAYGCGPGSYTTMGGLGGTGTYNDGTTTEFVQANARGVFNLIFGSWLGDWDHEDNFLRAPLATDSGLVSVWSGRPHWFLHAMGQGETIGHMARVAQNNTGLYQTQINSAQNRIHIALMGDPTLRLHPVAPAADLLGTQNGSSMLLSWSASMDTDLLGYHVYRAPTANGSFTRITTQPVTATTFTDATPAEKGTTYMVRAVKLESTTSGSYENPSQGAFWTVGGDENRPVAKAKPASPTESRPRTATGLFAGRSS